MGKTKRAYTLVKAKALSMLHALRALPKVRIAGLEFPLDSVSSRPSPSRAGIDPDDLETPFLHDDLDTLFKWYYGYERSLERQRKFPYAELSFLRDSTCGFEDGTDVSSLVLEVRRDAYTIPERLRPHGDAAVELFQRLRRIRIEPSTHTPQNETSARIRHADFTKGRLVVHPAKYFDQVATNLTLDWASGLINGRSDATVRNTVEPPESGKLRNLGDSVLANTLGVPACLCTADDEIVVPIRGTEQAVMAGRARFSCSASGVFQWSYVDSGRRVVGFSCFADGMCHEIDRELNLPHGSYTVHPLAFARELARGGKPQLFFLARTSLTASQVRLRMLDAEERWEFVPEFAIPENSPLALEMRQPQPHAGASTQLYTYEGLTALALTSAVLQARSLS